MKRLKFLQKISGLGLIPLLGFKTNESTGIKDLDLLRKELNAAWLRSEKMTLVNMEQMPSAFYKFKYTEEAMTFSEQWRHCVVFTCGQLASRAGISNPYQDVKLPVQMSKEEVIGEIKNMYSFVRKTIDELPVEKLCSNCDFAGDNIPVWRLFYALENHIIHHRGQCVVYLRLNGQIPKGFYGW